MSGSSELGVAAGWLSLRRPTFQPVYIYILFSWPAPGIGAHIDV